MAALAKYFQVLRGSWDMATSLALIQYYSLDCITCAESGRQGSLVFHVISLSPSRLRKNPA